MYTACIEKAPQSFGFHHRPCAQPKSWQLAQEFFRGALRLCCWCEILLRQSNAMTLKISQPSNAIAL